MPCELVHVHSYTHARVCVYFLCMCALSAHRGALEKIGVEPQVQRIGKYKRLGKIEWPVDRLFLFINFWNTLFFFLIRFTPFGR